MLAAVAAVALAGPVFAEDTEAALRAAIARHSDGKVVANSVAATPVPGVFEIVSGKDVFYVDRTGRYAFLDGRMVDMTEKRDLTQARLEALERIRFEALPLNAAIKTVRGTGARRLAVFEDPACPVCRALQANLAALDDVTIYTFTYPVIARESIPAAVSAWCAPDTDRIHRWKGYMAGTTPPDHIDPGCEQAMETVHEIVRFGEAHGIRNTPTLFLADGRRIVGAMPGDELAAALDTVARP
ncbi:MAG: DsbC family protein [Rhodocyclaceae bacterium]|nr:DsbC family protein [Rhodocyclaceae bacterium]